MKNLKIKTFFDFITPANEGRFSNSHIHIIPQTKNNISITPAKHPNSFVLTCCCGTWLRRLDPKPELLILTRNVDIVMVFVLFFCTETRIHLCNRYGSRIENVEFILVFVLFSAHGLGWWIGCETENVDFIWVFLTVSAFMHGIWNRKYLFYIGFLYYFCTPRRLPAAPGGRQDPPWGH